MADANSPWPQYSGPAAGGRQAAAFVNKGVNGTAPVLWRTDLGRGTVFGSPVLSSAGFLAVCAGGDIFVLSAASGAPIWTSSALSCDTYAPAWAPRVLVAAGVQGVGVLAATDGTLGWRFTGSGAAFYTPTLASYDGCDVGGTCVGTGAGEARVYIGSADNCLYALRLVDGSPAWSACLGAPVRSSVALAANLGLLFAAAEDGSVHGLRTADGTAAWPAFGLGALTVAAPALTVGGDALVLGSFAGAVVALGAADGTLRWSTSLGGRVHAVAARGVAGDMLVGSDNGTLASLDARTGALRWLWAVPPTATGAGVRSAAAVDAAGTVIFGSDSGAVLAVRAPLAAMTWGVENAAEEAAWAATAAAASADAADAAAPAPSPRLQWAVQTGGEVYSSPCIGTDGTVFVGSYDGSVWAISAPSAAPSAPVAVSQVAIAAAVLAAVTLVAIAFLLALRALPAWRARLCSCCAGRGASLAPVGFRGDTSSHTASGLVVGGLASARAAIAAAGHRTAATVASMGGRRTNAAGNDDDDSRSAGLLASRSDVL